MRPTRRELAFLLASWLVWAFVALHVRGTWCSLLGDGDHWSHFGCAELFLHHGFGIWDHPPAAYCSKQMPPAQEDIEKAADCHPVDWCDLRDQPGTLPVCINWQELGPNSYPPGLILYSLPQTLLWEHTHLTFRAINVLTILEYLLGAHLLLWILYRMVFRRRDDLPGGDGGDAANPWLRLALFALVYQEIIKRTLDGFYDPLPVFAMFLGVYLLAKRRPVDALLAISFSFFFHYRAVWYAPVLAVAALRSIPVVWSAPRKHALKLGLAGGMLLLFGYSLFLIYPWLHHWPETNPILWKSATLWKGKEWDLLLPMGLVLLYVAWGGHWLLFVTMAWQLYVISGSPHVYPWHALFLLPMLAVARLETDRRALLAAAVFCLVEAYVVYNLVPLPGELVAAVAGSWGPWHFAY
jgi:hypothetical protein